MPLLEATTLAIGTAIAKQVIKVWLGDNLASTAAQAAPTTAVEPTPAPVAQAPAAN